MAFEKRSIALSTTPLPQGSLREDTKTDGSLRPDRASVEMAPASRSALPGPDEEEEWEVVEEAEAPKPPQE
jgi:hypothetical protein